MTVKIFSGDFEALGAFDFESLASKPIQEAALALKQALCVLEGSEENIFHARMRILRVARTLEIWKLEDDPEVGAPFATIERWIRSNWPKSWRYCKDALEAEGTLGSVPISELSKISGANIKVLASDGLSSNLRTNSDVLEAAKNKTKDQFVEYLNTKHGQHLEPIRLMPKADVEEFETAIEMAMALEDCHSRAEAMKAIAVSYIQDHAAEYEHLKEASA